MEKTERSPPSQPRLITFAFELQMLTLALWYFGVGDDQHPRPKVAFVITARAEVVTAKQQPGLIPAAGTGLPRGEPRADFMVE
jgi:hypothetical protein